MSERDIFVGALALDAADRPAYLARACGTDDALRRRVERLLGQDEGSFSLLDDRAAGRESAGMTLPFSPSTAERDGVVVAGRYKLVERIGEGGMGSVWLAEQTEPVKRKVAVKLIRAGLDSKQVLARFEAERQALALMDHPNIAKVLDGGVHDGRPFFVMELVKGVPITEFCDTRKLTPTQRLELFVPVCQALQHAHQKGVIHRYIKPANVLVAMFDERAVPKVIDFGVAKATGPALTEHTLNTGFGGVIGTPQYMSPEQATFNNLDIDTRSDVYGLGVLLYELLTGSPPFSSTELERRGVLEVLRVVREVEPPKPSTKLSTADALPSLAANRGTEPRKLTGLLRNELDWVVMKALEKDRTRRYDSAHGFAADIQRYLAGEPVQAHPPSRVYRVRTFVRRNRGLVAAAALIVLALTVGLAGTSAGLYEARVQHAEARKQEGLARDEANEKERQRDLAVRERAKAIEFRNRAVGALRAATGEDVETLLGTRSVFTANEKAYLEAIARRWQEFAKQEGTDEQTRAIRAEGHSRVGQLWERLGRLDEARAEFERAVTTRAELVAEFPGVSEHRQDLVLRHLRK